MPPVPPLHLTLTYRFISPAEHHLHQVKRDGAILPNNTFQFNERGFRTFQLLLCETWKLRKEDELATYRLPGPENLTKPLYNAIRSTKPYTWTSYLFGDGSFDKYLDAGVAGKVPVCWVTLLVKIKIEIQDNNGNGHRPATPEEVDIIIAKLRDEKCVRSVDVSIISRSPPGDDKWTISGKSLDQSIYFGCHVQIRIHYATNTPPIVFWFSNHEIYELYPEMDARLFNVPKPIISRIGGDSELLIGVEPGIPIDTPAGVEACLAITADPAIDLGELRERIFTFFSASPVTSFQWDSGPTKRYFNSKSPRRIVGHRLGNPPTGRDWTNDLLQEVIPQGSIAVLLTLPLGEDS